MMAALATGTIVALLGLVTVMFLGHAASDAASLERHVALGVFVTLLALLAHSMTLFYLIGKGRAVREALGEAGLSTPESARRFAALRRPAFQRATLAMAATMATSILGGGVETGEVPSLVHAGVAYAALVAQVAAVRAELVALVGSARLVDEVNERLASR
jgi:hypothetical protein